MKLRRQVAKVAPKVLEPAWELKEPVLALREQATAEIKELVQVLVPKEQATAEIRVLVQVLEPKEQATAEIRERVQVLAPGRVEAPWVWVPPAVPVAVGWGMRS